MLAAILISGGLINVLVALIIVGFLYWIFTLIPLPPLGKQIGNIVFALVCVIILIDLLLGIAGRATF